MAGKWNLTLFAGLCVACLIATVYSGNIIYKRQFFNAEPYVPSVAASGAEVPTAKHYSELCDEVVALAQKAVSHGTIHLQNYDGDVEQDLQRVCDEVINQTPIGAYGVEAIYADFTRVLTYYDVKINISYKRAPEEILSVIEINSQDDLSENIRKAISERKESLAMLCMYYTPEIIDVPAACESMRFNSPWSVYGLDEYSTSVFPSDGVHRIIRMDFKYYEGGEQSQEKIAFAQRVAEEIAAATDAFVERERVEKICTMISDGVELITLNAAPEHAMPYSVLANKKGTTEGLAVTLNQVLADTGIYSSVVKGELNGQLHFWNKVFIEGAWRHVDMSRGIILYPDDAMLGYMWEDMEAPVGANN